MNTKLFSTIKKLLASVFAISFAMTLFMTPASFAQIDPNAFFVPLSGPGASTEINPAPAHVHLFNEGDGFQVVEILGPCEVNSTTLSPSNSQVFECDDIATVTLGSITPPTADSTVEVIWHQEAQALQAPQPVRSFNRYPSYRW